MKNLIILTTVAIVLVGTVVFLFSKDTAESPALSPSPTLTSTSIPSTSSGQVTSPQATSTPIVEETPVSSPTISNIVVIYSDSGYSPATVIVKKGDTVVFDNKSSKMMWTASAVHPTHRAYPGSGIEMCGTNTLVAIFDACRGYGLSESWGFKFKEIGIWKYHNHMQANHTGTIVVE